MGQRSGRPRRTGRLRCGLFTIFLALACTLVLLTLYFNRLPDPNKDTGAITADQEVQGLPSVAFCKRVGGQRREAVCRALPLDFFAPAPSRLHHLPCMQHHLHVSLPWS